MTQARRTLFYILGVAFIAISFTSAYFSDNVSVSNNTFSTGVSSHSDIAINEFMPDPVGADMAPKLDGEWVELYNKGNWSIDVNGWHLYDSVNTNDLPISGANVGGGSTVVPAKGYLVVYRDGDGNFALHNADPDQVRLFDGPILTSVLIDSVSYTGSTEDKTWARVPDGTGVWLSDQTKTKGESNE